MNEKEKNPVGAPRQMEGGKRRNVYLDDVTVEEAKRLGGGDLSKGLRLAVAAQSRAGKADTRR